jgi:hypothetical protein
MMAVERARDYVARYMADKYTPEELVARRKATAGWLEANSCAGCPDCQGIPGPRPCVAIAETGERCILDIGHGGLHK